MRVLLALILLLNFLPVSADQPDWVSLGDTVTAAFDENTPDVSKQIYLFQRCSAQHLSMSWVLEEANTELAANFDRTSASLAQAAALTRIMLATERTGNQQDAEAISKSTLEAITMLFEEYKSWLNSNYIANGSYFENDIDFQLEIEICKMAAQISMSLLGEP